jgi:hypothetical protein
VGTTSGLDKENIPEHSFVEIVLLAQIVADSRLVQALFLNYQQHTIRQTGSFKGIVSRDWRGLLIVLLD